MVGSRFSSFQLANEVVKVFDHQTSAISPSRVISPELLADVLRVFGDEEKARRWLLAPRGVFEGRSPAQMAATPEGEALVREVLTRIEHGIFS